MRSRLIDWLAGPEDPAGLAVFRIGFGLVLAMDAARYLLAGWAVSYYAEPRFLFKYFGFEWVEPLPPAGMVAVFVVALVAAVVFAVGRWHRPAAATLLLVHTYVFLLAAEHYLNHAYLICVLLALVLVMPLDRALVPGRPTSTVPRWPRALLRAQLAIVYGYGALAKIDGDWLAGAPVRFWLERSARRVPPLGSVLTQDLTADVIVWGGLVFDALVVPLLLWPRTRWLAVIASVCFHGANTLLFDIGVFPYLMLFATTSFFDPSWPRRIRRLGSRMQAPSPGDTRLGKATLVGATAWLLAQLVVPLRHHLYPGPVAWTEEGHYFAWRMKLRSKRGEVTFVVRDPTTGETWRVRPADELTKTQVSKMAGHPKLILQYAHHLADRFARDLGRRPEVRVETEVSLNYRERQPIIDPDVDLAAEPWTLAPAPWIVPFRWTPPPRPDR